MPKFILNDEPENEEHRLHLYLEDNEDGSVSLKADDLDTGDSWYLLTLHADGTTYLVSCIGSDTGLKLDREGRLKVTRL